MKLPALLSLVVLPWILSCSSGGDAVDPGGGFSISVSPNALAIEQGSTDQATVTLTRTGGFSGNVTFTVEGLPAGIGGVLSGLSGTGTTTTTTATITVSVAAGVDPGVYPLTIRGRANGQSDRTAQVTITVTERAGIALSLLPTTVTVAAGSAGQTVVMLTRSGPFTSAVALSATGLPGGVTAGFAPASLASGVTGSVLTLTVGAGATPGSYPFTVTGTGAGVTAASVAATVNVLPAEEVGFTISIDPTALEIPQGQSEIATVTVTRVGGFTGTVELAVDAPPSDLVVEFNPESLGPGQTTSIMTVTVPAPAPAPAGASQAVGEGPSAIAPGAYALTVTGRSQGEPDATVNLNLTVTPLQTGSFSFAVDQGSVSVQQGESSALIGLTLNRVAPFVAGVAFSTQGLPTNVFLSFFPSTIAAGGTTGSIQVTAAGGATPGVYPVTLIGTPDAIGVDPVTVNFTITITAAPPLGDIVWQFCDPDFEPLWFAYQDGAGVGPWIPLAEGANTTYTFSLGSSTAGVAWVLPDGSGGFSTLVTFSSKAALTALAAGSCAATPPTKTLNGSVVGLGATDNALISVGTGVTTATGISPAFQIQNVPTGSRTLVGIRSVFDLPSLSYMPTSGIIRRNVDYPDMSTIPALDFGTEGFALEQHPITLNNLLGWVAGASANYFTDGGGSVGILVQGGGGGAGPFAYSAIPNARQVAGDFHYLAATALPSILDPSQYRSVGRYFYDAGPAVLEFGPPVAVPTITSLGGGGYARLRMMGTVQDEYNRLLHFGYSQPGKSAFIQVTGTPFATGGGATYTVAFPNFSGLAGFLDIWMPDLVGDLTWTMAALGWDGDGLLGAALGEGVVVRSAGTGAEIIGGMQHER